MEQMRRGTRPPIRVLTIDGVPLVFSNPIRQPADTWDEGGAIRRDNSSRRIQAASAIGFWHRASLDAPTVAVVWALAFAWAARVSLPWWIPVLLALAAWAVYVADRLLDARRAMRSGRTRGLRERHFFHWRHRRILAPMAAAAAAAAGGIAIGFMPAPARERGTVLAAAALGYFSCVHFAGMSATRYGRRLGFRIPKELLVGVLFTAASVLPAWNRVSEQSWEFAAAAAYFAALAWLNCHAIDRWEDLPCESFSNGIAVATSALGLAGMLAAIGAGLGHSRWGALLAPGAAAALLLGLLDRVRGRLSPLALRAAADLALLTPLVLLLRR